MIEEDQNGSWKFNYIHNEVKDIIKSDNDTWVNQYLSVLSEKIDENKKTIFTQKFVIYLIWILLIAFVIFSFNNLTNIRQIKLSDENQLNTINDHDIKFTKFNNNVQTLQNELTSNNNSLTEKLHWVEQTVVSMSDQITYLEKQKEEINKISNSVELFSSGFDMQQKETKEQFDIINESLGKISEKILFQKGSSIKQYVNIIKDIKNIENKILNIPSAISSIYDSIWLVASKTTFTDLSWNVLNKDQFKWNMIKYFLELFDALSDEIYNSNKGNYWNLSGEITKEQILVIQKHLYTLNLIKEFKYLSWKEELEQTSFWTSFIYSWSYLLTNNHVVHPEIYNQNDIINMFSNNFNLSHGYIKNKIDKIKFNIIPKVKTLKIYFPNFKYWLNAKLIKNDSNMDLALVQIVDDKFQLLDLKNINNFSSDQQIGEQIIIFWYPNWITTLIAKQNMLSQSSNIVDKYIHLTEKEVEEKIFDMLNDLSQSNLVKPTVAQGYISDKNNNNIFFDAQIAPWNSWWPIINWKWELVWITYAILKDVWSVNYWITVEIIKDFLNDFY